MPLKHLNRKCRSLRYQFLHSKKTFLGSQAIRLKIPNRILRPNSQKFKIRPKYKVIVFKIKEVVQKYCNIAK